MVNRFEVEPCAPAEQGFEVRSQQQQPEQQQVFNIFLHWGPPTPFVQRCASLATSLPLSHPRAAATCARLDRVLTATPGHGQVCYHACGSVGGSLLLGSVGPCELMTRALARRRLPRERERAADMYNTGRLDVPSPNIKRARAMLPLVARLGH